ncbi:hypothetical protein KC19_10G037500 [Ceratodon purpureus]|uniref:Uncharacterized protein n=1 Tax=Ceratodon purpureus TaxID=3225 RepID=A0A8T0GLE3_CERPU|nr:hypothetical protein KC19_10G037500 [Ceratodon purpureus]
MNEPQRTRPNSSLHTTEHDEPRRRVDEKRFSVAVSSGGGFSSMFGGADEQAKRSEEKRSEDKRSAQVRGEGRAIAIAGVRLPVARRGCSLGRAQRGWNWRGRWRREGERASGRGERSGIQLVAFVAPSESWRGDRCEVLRCCGARRKLCGDFLPCYRV